MALRCLFSAELFRNLKGYVFADKGFIAQIAFEYSYLKRSHKHQQGYSSTGDKFDKPFVTWNVGKPGLQLFSIISG